MAQIQVRDEQGNPIQRINIRIAERDGASEAAIFDYDTDLAGNKGWPIPFWPDHEWTLHVNKQDVNPEFESAEVRVPQGHHSDIQITLTRKQPARPEPIDGSARTGVPHREGKAVRDDQGSFLPLGLTFFWGLFGWKFERDRVLAHLDWIAQFGFDYLRILGEVDWAGRSIDPRWDDYETVLSEFTDAAYARGLRTQVSLIGGKPDENTAMLLARKVANVVAANPQKFLFLEMANEWDVGPKTTIKTMQRMTSEFRGRVPNMFALSKPKDSKLTSWEEIDAATKAVGGHVLPIHHDRKDADNGWRNVRQGYDFHNTDLVTGHNEGSGPQSSGSTLDNPLQLVMHRTTGVISGGALYCLHVGQGVTGRADAKHGRPENMWEVPQIEQIMRSLRQLDSILNPELPNWKVVNNRRNDHPLPTPNPDTDDYFWGDGLTSNSGVNKNYAAIRGNQFVMVLNGIKNEFPMVASKDMLLTIFDPVTLELTQSTALGAGKKLIARGRPDGMTGAIILGEFV